MKCVRTGRDVRAGDVVRVEGGVRGIVVCDYGHWECVDGYERFLTRNRMFDGSTLGAGVMVDAEHFGLILYPEQEDEMEILSA